MRSRRTDEQGELWPGRIPARFPGQSARRRFRAQAGIAALSALLTVALGSVSAADVCKLSVCWLSQADKEAYECSEDCYFDEYPLDASPAAQCPALVEHELDVDYMYRD